MASLLEEKTKNWMDRCFPEKTLKVKSTDDPWISHEIREKIKTRKRVFSRSKKKTYSLLASTEERN